MYISAVQYIRMVYGTDLLSTLIGPYVRTYICTVRTYITFKMFYTDTKVPYKLLYVAMYIIVVLQLHLFVKYWFLEC